MEKSGRHALDTLWPELRAALAQDYVTAPVPDESGAIRSAVLLLLYFKGGEAHTVLTRRTNHLAAHKGEISLPGGAFEADKDLSLLHTALREAAEEVGIDPSALQVIGRLPFVYTMSTNYVIAPYVAASAQQPLFRPDPFEVAEVLEVPLSTLRDPRTLREEDWEIEGTVRPITFYAYGEHRIWGATQRILSDFLAIVEHRAA